MIYTEMTKKAMKICFRAHKDQTDKGGMPYVFHPYHLAEQMKDEESVCVALLHDVAEDSEITIEEIRAEGFSDTVMEALIALTHLKDEPYTEYIERVKTNPLAVKIKKADMRHNMDETRLPEGFTEIESAKIWRKKYKNGWKQLNKK